MATSFLTVSFCKDRVGQAGEGVRMSQGAPTPEDIASLEYDLVSSALGFLARSVQTFNSSACVHTVAFAVVELATAVEVLMKARLVRQDWMQVCMIPGRWRFDQLTNGAAKTISP